MSSDPETPAGREALLAAVLDLDFAAFADDLEFYRNIARLADGPVLELGVGAGRVATALARAGMEVWGIDSFPPILARAQKHAGAGLASKLVLRNADMRDFDLGQRFEFAYAAFGTFHHLLTPDGQLACLRCVQRHLAPGGLFAFDLRPFETADWEEGDSAALWHDWTRILPESGETVIKLRSVRPDLAGKLQRESHIYDRIDQGGTVRRLTSEVDLRFSTRYEVEGLLAEAGLECEHVYGDFDLAPYREDSEYMITVARRPAKDAK